MGQRDFVLGPLRESLLGLDGSRPEVTEPAPTKLASTVMLVRDDEGPLEVFMLRRVSSMAFAPSMHVFPGGGVDVRDAEDELPWAGPSVEEWAEMFGTDEVLVAAKHLLSLDGVELAEDVTEVTYVHVLFDRHEVVYAEGAQSESLYTGEQALRAVGDSARAEIFALFPELAAGTVPGARKFLTGRQGRDLAARHAGIPLQ